MRKKLSILFFVILLIASWVALAEGNPSDVTLVKLTDLSIGFGLPGDMAPTEDNATINDEGVPYFAFITEDQHLIVEFYGSNFKDLSEAADWATEHIGEQITKHNVTINGMKAIEYHYVRTMDDGLEIFTDVFFAVNDAEEVFEFWETTDIEERSGLLSSEVYPLSYFSENADLNSEGETASDGAASDSESGTAADGAASASGDETASVSEGTATGICTANKVNLRAEPKANARSLGQIHKGEKLVLLETEGDWTKVSCSKGEGYIKTQYIEVQ